MGFGFLFFCCFLSFFSGRTWIEKKNLEPVQIFKKKIWAKHRIVQVCLVYSSDQAKKKIHLKGKDVEDIKNTMSQFPHHVKIRVSCCWKKYLFTQLLHNKYDGTQGQFLNLFELGVFFILDWLPNQG